MNLKPFNFAKLFDMPNGGQVLVTKEVNSDDNSESVADIRFEARFDIGGGILTPTVTAGFATDKECDEDFQKANQQQAEGVFNALIKEFDYIIK